MRIGRDAAAEEIQDLDGTKKVEQTFVQGYFTRAAQRKPALTLSA